MNEAGSTSGPPKSILLATDLSARCDRALDRAVSLSQLWQTKLVVLNVLESRSILDTAAIVPSWRRPPDPTSVAESQLLVDIGPVAKAADVVIEEGEPAEAIVRVAETRGCDLIVTGIARDELLGRFILGTTVDRLLRSAPAPVLVVKNRARQHYRHVAVATDFSETSRHALEAALQYFPEQVLTILHAYDPPITPFMTEPAVYRREYRQVAEQEYEAFLAAMKSGAAIKRRARAFIEFGTPAQVLREGVRDLGIDLVVMGTRGRGAVSELLLGSVAKQIMAELPCDALVIRGPRNVAGAVA
jgi:nucleotide-binding universal stress UspA family protein